MDGEKWKEKGITIMSKVLVITTSLRAKSNTDILASRVAEGAKDAGHDVSCVSLKGKEIKYCIGCLGCQKTGKCVLKDDVPEIMESVRNADTLVFASPIYYYSLSGLMKTFLDRMNPLYGSEYKFRNIYLLTTAADDAKYTPEKAVNCLQGWIDCFEKAELKGSIFCPAINGPGEANSKPKELQRAYDFGKNLL